jgi:hypothetical protein
MAPQTVADIIKTLQHSGTGHDARSAHLISYILELIAKLHDVEKRLKRSHGQGAYRVFLAAKWIKLHRPAWSGCFTEDGTGSTTGRVAADNILQEELRLHKSAVYYSKLPAMATLDRPGRPNCSTQQRRPQGQC